jgi:hypothetical protein
MERCSIERARLSHAAWRQQTLKIEGNPFPRGALLSLQEVTAVGLLDDRVN